MKKPRKERIRRLVLPRSLQRTIECELCGAKFLECEVEIALEHSRQRKKEVGGGVLFPGLVIQCPPKFLITDSEGGVVWKKPWVVGQPYLPKSGLRKPYDDFHFRVYQILEFELAGGKYHAPSGRILIRRDMLLLSQCLLMMKHLNR